MKELFAHAEAGENGVHQVVPDVPAVQLTQGLQRRLAVRQHHVGALADRFDNVLSSRVVPAMSVTMARS